MPSQNFARFTSRDALFSRIPDTGTAIYLHHLGFKALATTSAGFAFARGKADGAVPRDEMLAHISEIVKAAPLPVNADFLNGYADNPEHMAENVKLCIDTGVAGLSIEDNTGRPDSPLYEKDLAVERFHAARSAINASGTRVMLTGRCEAWLVGDADPLRTALNRLVAYAEAGADCLYAPGVQTPDEIAQIVKAVAPKPVNLLIFGFNHQLSFSQSPISECAASQSGPDWPLRRGAHSSAPRATFKQAAASSFWTEVPNRPS